MSNFSLSLGLGENEKVIEFDKSSSIEKIFPNPTSIIIIKDCTNKKLEKPKGKKKSELSTILSNELNKFLSTTITSNHSQVLSKEDVHFYDAIEQFPESFGKVSLFYIAEF